MALHLVRHPLSLQGGHQRAADSYAIADHRYTRATGTACPRTYQSSSQRRPTVRPPTVVQALLSAGHVVAHRPTATHRSQQDIFGIQMLRTDVSSTVSQYGVFERAYVWLLC